MDGTDGLSICSVVENRAREVCICKMDTSNRSMVELFLINDSHSYAETVQVLSSIQPQEILLQDGSQKKTLTQKIVALHSQIGDASTRVVFISRQYFDQDRGADMLKQVAASDVDADLIAKYIVLAGCYCLLRYVENCSGTYLQHNSLRVMYSSLSSQRMHIDRHTACNLEIISDLRTGNQRDSLFGAIKMTKTVVGARLLKSNLLRPLTDGASIEARYDAVEVLLRSPQAFSKMSSLLPTYPDLDRCLSGLTTSPRVTSARTASIAIETLLMLKSSIKLAAQTSQVLQELCFEAELRGSKCMLLHAIDGRLSDTTLDSILSLIEESLSEGVTFSKRALEMKHNECFAVKSGVSAKLDISRVAFLDSVEQIYALANEYCTQLNCAVKVMHNASRGYYLQIPSTIAFLPDDFIQAVQQRKTISCTTKEVLSLSDRANECIHDCLVLSNDLLMDLTAQIRTKIDSVFTLVDCIALLDVLLSFADLVALSQLPYTRPVLKRSGPMVIQKGRHPIVERAQKQHFIENDTFLSPLSNFVVITGFNGAGKTVYLKQVALIVILAQIGCFVPATYACIVIRDRILSRIGTADDIGIF